MYNFDKNNLINISISLFMIFINFGLNVFIGIIVGMILFILAIRKKIKIFDKKIFLKLGGMSYIIFLIHQNIGYQILIYLCTLFGKFNPVFILVTFFIILIVSYLLYKYVECYMQNKINKYYRRN